MEYEKLEKEEDPLMSAVDAEEAGQYEMAFSLFERLAAQGDTYAMTALARFYEDGLGVEADFDKSIYWAEKAAVAGDPIGMSNLAISYRRIGEMLKAKEWFERALASGFTGAALELAKMYMISDKESENVKRYLGIVLRGSVGNEISEDEFNKAKELLSYLNSKN